MGEWVGIALLTFAIGLAMFLGALIASVEHISNKWLESELRHSVIAFGGGILISAVALVLVPEGIKNLTPPYVALWFGLGGLAFMLTDRILSAMHTKFDQLAAMLLDFVPEVIALGSLYLLARGDALLLGLLIALQNLPEGFNAYLELRASSKLKSGVILCSFFSLALLGPVGGLTGYFFLAESPEVISGVMLFSAGGILYLIFQDIAPQAKLKRHWAPTFGAVLGFLCGIISKMVI